MKRLTENGQIILDGTLAKCEKEQIILERYSQIEDIEQELGIDLITLLKALKNGIWVRYGFYGTCYLDGKPTFIESSKLHLGFNDYSEIGTEGDYNDLQTDYCLCFYDMDYEETDKIVRVKDYGKTWALDKKELTKEELL